MTCKHMAICIKLVVLKMEIEVPCSPIFDAHKILVNLKVQVYNGSLTSLPLYTAVFKSPALDSWFHELPVKRFNYIAKPAV